MAIHSIIEIFLCGQNGQPALILMTEHIQIILSSSLCDVLEEFQKEQLRGS